MLPTGRLFVPPLVVLLLSFLLASNTALSQEEHAAFWKVVRTVEDILGGKNLDQATATVTKGARLICGSRNENLRDVVAGKVTTCSLADTAFHGVAIQARTNDSEDMGYILLKTVKVDTTNVRFHTVVVLKDSTGEFKIISWHAG